MATNNVQSMQFLVRTNREMIDVERRFIEQKSPGGRGLFAGLLKHANAKLKKLAALLSKPEPLQSAIRHAGWQRTSLRVEVRSRLRRASISLAA